MTFNYQWVLKPQTTPFVGYVATAFNTEEIEKIIEIGQNPEYSTIENGKVGESGEENNDIRKSKVSWIRSDIKETQWIFRKLTDHIVRSNNLLFKYDLDYIENIQFTEYDSENQGFYNKHIDVFSGPGKPRKITCVVQLSDPTTYEGGKLLLHTSHEPQRTLDDLGMLIMFPVHTLHEVTPITKGKRYSLVAWVCGPSFK